MSIDIDQLGNNPKAREIVDKINEIIQTAGEGGGGFDDAPEDGSPYGRQDAEWVKIVKLAEIALTSITVGVGGDFPTLPDAVIAMSQIQGFALSVTLLSNVGSLAAISNVVAFPTFQFWQLNLNGMSWTVGSTINFIGSSLGGSLYGEGTFVGPVVMENTRPPAFGAVDLTIHAPITYSRQAQYRFGPSWSVTFDGIASLTNFICEYDVTVTGDLILDGGNVFYADLTVSDTILARNGINTLNTITSNGASPVISLSGGSSLSTGIITPVGTGYIVSNASGIAVIGSVTGVVGIDFTDYVDGGEPNTITDIGIVFVGGTGVPGPSIPSISVSETKTVASSGADFTTIANALDYVRARVRLNGAVVTIQYTDPTCTEQVTVMDDLHDVIITSSGSVSCETSGYIPNSFGMVSFVSAIGHGANIQLRGSWTSDGVVPASGALSVLGGNIQVGEFFSGTVLDGWRESVSAQAGAAKVVNTSGVCTSAFILCSSGDVLASLCSGSAPYGIRAQAGGKIIYTQSDLTDCSTAYVYSLRGDILAEGVDYINNSGDGIFLQADGGEINSSASSFTVNGGDPDLARALATGRLYIQHNGTGGGTSTGNRYSVQAGGILTTSGNTAAIFSGGDSQATLTITTHGFIIA